MPRSQEGLARLVERDGASPGVVLAFRKVARSDFVPEDSRRVAYTDRPIQIPERQTTSQPTLIARMIDSLDLSPDARVLEVGSGYGFQTALLSCVAAEVYSIERHERLASAARANLERAGFAATVEVGDGWNGLPEKAPYDAIVVSAAAEEVPVALVDQLAEGGRMVIPVAGRRGDEVILFQKIGGRLVHQRLITPARFVPLVREPGG